MDIRKIKEARSSEELKGVLAEVMDEIVMEWWRKLDEDAKKAICLLKNSRAVVSSIMFFDVDSCLFACDYSGFLASLKNKFADISDKGDINSFYRYDYICDTYLRLKKEKEKVRNKVSALGLSEKLSNDVMKELLQKEGEYKKLEETFNNRIERIRKELLWQSFNKVLEGAYT